MEELDCSENSKFRSPRSGTPRKSPLLGRSPSLFPYSKRVGVSDCTNHKGNRLITIASKLLSSIILRSLYDTHEGRTREEHTRFHTGRGCVDQLSTVRQVVGHRPIFFANPTIVVFLDVRAAFGSVDRSAL